MPPKNRPRIAGQRRTPTPVTPVTEPSSTEPSEAAQTAPEVTPGNHPTPKKPTPTDRPEAHAEDAAPGTSIGAAAPTASRQGSASTEPAPAGPGGRTARVLAVVLGVLIVLVLALAGVLGVKAWRGKQAEDARGEAAAAGRKAAETALSYDYRKLDQSFSDARATMTPEFAAKFDETAKVAGELATKTKATVRAEVREVGVRDGDADRVTLIIFVNQTTTSTITQGKPRVDLNRTRFTMVRSGTRWLVQEIAGL